MSEDSEQVGNRPLEVALNVGENMYKQLIFDRLEDVTYTKLTATWSKYRDISEVRTFIWMRVENGYQKAFLIQDDDDLRAALVSENKIMIRAQGHGHFQRDFALAVLLFVILHYILNLSMVWPLCRGDVWSLCLTNDALYVKGEL